MEPNGAETPHALPRSQVTVKTVLTVSFTVLGIVFGVYILSRTLVSVGIVVAGALVSVALDHGVRHLQNHGWKRSWAIATVLLTVTGLLVGLGWLVVPEAAHQVQDLVARLPDLLEQLRGSPAFRALDQRFNIGRILEGRAAMSSTLPQTAVETSVRALRLVLGGSIVLLTLIFTIIFMLVFGGELVRRLLEEAVPSHRERYERLVRRVYEAVGGYIAGLAILALAHATVNTTALAIFGLPFFLPLGLASGLGSFIPFVGAVIVGAFMGIIGLASGGIWLGLGVIAWYTLYQQLENHLLAPLVYKRTVRLSPLVALLAVIFVGEAAGIVGAILAVPLAAVGRIVVQELLRFRRERLEVPPGVPVSEALEERPPDSPPPA